MNCKNLEENPAFKTGKEYGKFKTKQIMPHAVNKREYFLYEKEIGACYRNNYFIVNPLAYWSDDYLWDYIDGERLQINPLYRCGFSRIGCIGCPMAGVEGRLKEFERYPKFKARFIKLCNDITLLRNTQSSNKKNFKSGTEYFEWWINNNKSTLTDEYNLFNYGETI